MLQTCYTKTNIFKQKVFPYYLTYNYIYLFTNVSSNIMKRIIYSMYRDNVNPFVKSLIPTYV